eukprot:GHVR01116520.1.p1 GENE.GHVR01116520.1~~GHVR01116520.1.p1  ORF type:complete len:369 (+),score=48.25 GHVR01116520.1:12-1118(+)
MKCFAWCLCLLLAIVFAANDFSTCEWTLEEKCMYGTYSFVRKATCKTTSGEEVFMLKIPRGKDGDKTFETEYAVTEDLRKADLVTEVANSLIAPLAFLHCGGGTPLNAFAKQCLLRQEIPIEEGEQITKIRFSFIIVKYPETKKSRCLLFPVASEGSFNDKYLAKNDEKLDEEISRNYIRWFIQAAKAVQLLGKYDIIHRDIHPGNLLINKKDDQLDMLISDFGLAIKEGDIRQGVGDGYFTAPEVTRYFAKYEYINTYDHKSDVFMLGVSFLIVLRRTNAYYDIIQLLQKQCTPLILLEYKLQHMKETIDKFKSNKWYSRGIDDEKFEKLINLLEDMIEPNPLERVSIETVLSTLDEIEHTTVNEVQ